MSQPLSPQSPQSPQSSQSVQSRRSFLRRVAWTTAAAATATVLAACGSSESATPTVAGAATNAATSPPVTGATTAPVMAASATSAPAAPATGATTAPATTGMASAPAPATVAAAPKLSGPVVYWSRETQDNGTREPIIQQQLAAFDKMYGTQSSVLFLPTMVESVAKEQASLAAGNPPDVGQQGAEAALQFALADNLVPIDDVNAAIQDQLLPIQREAAFTTYNNVTYGVPWWVSANVLFYHKDLLDKAGVKPPTTWQEWLDAAKALAKGEEQFGLVFPPETAGPGQLYVPLATSAGGNLLTAEGKINANTPPFHQALQFLSDLYTSGGVPKSLLTYKNADVDQLFFLKKAAMYWSTGTTYQGIKAQHPELVDTLGAVMTPVRTPGDISRSFLGGYQLFVFKGKNPTAGKELVKWLLEPTFYANYIGRTNGGSLPVTKAVGSQPIYQSDPILKTLIQQQQTAIRSGGTLRGNAPWLGAAIEKNMISQPVVDVFAGKRSVDDEVAFWEMSLKMLAKEM